MFGSVVNVLRALLQTGKLRHERSSSSSHLHLRACRYDAGKILTVGGAPAYADSNAHKDAVIITLNGKKVTTKKIGGMAYARAFANSVVLPDGTVLIVGGQPRPVPFTDTDAVLVPGASCGLRLDSLLRCSPAHPNDAQTLTSPMCA